VSAAVSSEDEAMEPQSATTPRLVRRSHGRMIAGVCKGIADHFGIDPILVRIAFVVITFFGGAGVIAYAAAWLLIPEEGETTSIGERVLHEHRWGRIAGFVLIAIALSSLLRPVWWGGGHALFPVLLIIGGLYLLSPGFSGRGNWPQTLPDTPPPTAEMPFTQEYPPPTPAPPRPKRRGGLGALTFGLLFIGGGLVGLLLASGNTIEPAYVFAAGLLIVGAALVVSTWFGRSFVLIPLGVVLAGLMSISTVIDVPITGGVGDQRATPFVLADLHDDYHLGMGELQLDLSHLTFDRGTAHTVKATVGIGHLLVTLPRNVTAELHGHAGLGEVRFLGQHDGGIRVDRDTTLSAGGESPPRIVLDVEVGIGQVEVVDAAA
jgi:phage shock protein PspC (stress-responsive transcriptional regulator)/predicted membrane protein